MEKLDFFTEENRLADHQKETLSPSGKYKVVIDYFKTGEGTWDFTRGIVIRTKDDSEVARVHRNYSSFWHCWVEHSNGNEYLLCGEDYQGYSVVNATQGTWQHYRPEDASQGWGWCFAQVWPSPDGKLLAVAGCYWACPYELRIFDLSDPDTLPFPLLDRFGDDTTHEGWVDNETFAYACEIEIDARADMEPYELGLSDDEWDEVHEKDPQRVGYRRDTFYWKLSTYEQVKNADQIMRDTHDTLDAELTKLKDLEKKEKSLKEEKKRVLAEIAQTKESISQTSEEIQGHREHIKDLAFRIKNQSRIKQSRWGWHYCTPFHYQKLKFLHKKFWEAIYAQARWQRWIRKEPQNRIGPEPEPVPIFTVDMERPSRSTAWDAFRKQPKFRDEVYFNDTDDQWRIRYVIDYGIFADFQKARRPAPTWLEVQPLEVSEEKVDELVKMFPDQPFFYIEPTEETGNEEAVEQRGTS